MNEEIKARWVEALRSGEYMQGQMLLRSRDPILDVDRFCCLGVLCEIAVQDGVIEVEVTDGLGTYFHPQTTDDSSDISLPFVVLAWAGLPVEQNEVLIDHPTRGPLVLSAYNDSLQWTFGQIADLIEEML